MGFLDWLKTPEGAFIIGMPVGYFVIDFAKKQLTAYLERTGVEIGKSIARGMGQKTLTNGYYELDPARVYKALEDLSSRIANIEKMVGYKNE
ncbi:MAG: hypothetical protein QMD12_00910 [Candidatus Aenigmarchaeota archaeon]|nr:hypothetical protein [Candidatus Aenigmarchaeota archaeon]